MERLIILLLSRYNQTIDSTKELTRENPRFKIVSKAGRYGGTWAIEEMVYAYAAWLSAE